MKRQVTCALHVWILTPRREVGKMPIFKNFWSLEIARNFKAFLRLEAGLTRGGTPGAGLDQQREIEHLRRQLAERQGADHAPSGGVRPENIVWIFGTARVGSTWLAQMFAMLPYFSMWREPYVGRLFGQLFYEHARPWQTDSEHFVLGQPRDKWLPHVRHMVLDGASAATQSGPEGNVVVKEPNGSIGAPILMDAVPESGMAAIIRDPRDVVASAIDADTGWARKNAPGGKEEQARLPLVRRVSNKYVSYVGNSLKAYEAHEGRKTLVRYETLRTDTLETMRTVVQDLALDCKDSDVLRAVEKTAWENISEEKKGTGKFHRKAEPGGWREDLGEREVAEIEKITGKMMDELEYERST